jgi:hypothetical protein
MYAGTSAPLADHTARGALPRPGSASRTAVTSVNSAASASAASQVRSVLPLSASL